MMARPPRSCPLARELEVLRHESTPDGTDRTAGAAITFVAPQLPSCQAAGAAEESVFYTGEPTLAWRIETVPNATVRIYIDDELAQTVTADVDGSLCWTSRHRRRALTSSRRH